MDWPYSTVVSGPTPDPDENQYFTIEGKIRNHYVDFPNHVVQQFLSQVLNQIPEQHPGKPEMQYEAAIDAKEQINEIFHEVGLDFLQFRIVDESSTHPHPFYGIRLHGLEADSFERFLDEMAESEEEGEEAENHLEAKYHYLQGSKYPLLEVESKSRSPQQESRQRLQTAVEERVISEKESAEETVDELLEDIKAWRDELQTYWRRQLWQSFNTFPAVHFYLLEMEHIISGIGELANRGSIPPCYREMRKLLENLSWAAFDDLLFINANYAQVYSENPSIDRVPPRPFLNANQQWFNWNRAKNGPVFETRRKNLRDQIHDHCTQSRLDYDDKYGANIHKITAKLKENLSYPLYIALSGIAIENEKLVNPFVDPVSVDFLDLAVKYSVSSVLRSIKDGRRLGKQDRDFVDRVTADMLDTEGEFLVPPFPSNNQVIGYIDDLWHQNIPRPLDNFYEEYSFFIHSYPSSWQLFAHSSVLEFKIFDVELKRYSRTVGELLEHYLGDLHRH